MSSLPIDVNPLLTTEDIKKVAHLAKLKLTKDDFELYFKQLTTILKLAAEMDKVNTDNILPMANPLDLSQPLRPDEVTEINQRSLFQSIAPSVQAGLYLVPQVIDNE